MLIHNYSTQIHRTPNNATLTTPTPSTPTFKLNWIIYPTAPLDTFSTITPSQLQDLFDQQQQAVTQEADDLFKFNLLSKSSYDITLTQYKHIYFHTDNLAYRKSDLLAYANKLNRQSTPLVSDNIKHTNSTNSSVVISRQAIRDITNFTFNPIPAWSTDHTPVYIAWQEELLNAKEDVVIVNGSRQMGKSLVLSQLLIEDSFLPNNDAIVVAFQQSTTDIIKNYILKSIEAFETEDGTNPMFLNKDRKNYIENLNSGSRTHFRTLDDKARNVRWLTVSKVVVDEAQEIDVITMETAVLPTLTTTNGQLILIGTPGPERSGFMYQEILRIRSGKYYNWPHQPTARIIDVDVLHNPMAHPNKVQSVLARRNEPSIRREYFNEWGAGADKLFSPTIITSHTPNPTNSLIIAIDPARKQDRSAFTLLECGNGHITSILSDIVPDTHKFDWQLQAVFFKDLIQRFQKIYPSLYVVIDETWVGDGVTSIFREKWINISAQIRYTSWDSESQSHLGYNVGKSRLIQYTLDMIETNVYQIVQSTNLLLLNELDSIESKIAKTKESSFLRMVSHSYDDITNATMIGIFLANKYRLHQSNMNSTASTPSYAQLHNQAYSPTWLSPNSPYDTSTIW